MHQKIFTAISENVFEGSSSGVVSAVNDAIVLGIPVGEILSSGLLDGMSRVGDLFRDGEMFVPEVLVSAKALQAGMDLIRPALVLEGVETTGRILTATVEGDLHDIGVKLVGLMLEGAGFEVINLGVDVNAKDIIGKVREFQPDILALSAMLTTTMVKMKEVIDSLKEEGLLDCMKVMVGGAPLTPAFAEKIGAYYSADASEAVMVAKGFRR